MELVAAISVVGVGIIIIGIISYLTGKEKFSFSKIIILLLGLFLACAGIYGVYCESQWLGGSKTLCYQMNQPVESEKQIYGFEIVGKYTIYDKTGIHHYIDVRSMFQKGEKYNLGKRESPILRHIETTSEFASSPSSNPRCPRDNNDF